MNSEITDEQLMDALIQVENGGKRREVSKSLGLNESYMTQLINQMSRPRIVASRAKQLKISVDDYVNSLNKRRLFHDKDRRKMNILYFYDNMKISEIAKEFEAKYTTIRGIIRRNGRERKKRTFYSDETIIEALKMAEDGYSKAEIENKHSLARNYIWDVIYGRTRPNLRKARCAELGISVDEYPNACKRVANILTAEERKKIIEGRRQNKNVYTISVEMGKEYGVVWDAYEKLKKRGYKI